ncbi:MAG: glycosyltransferase family 4 protein [Minwuia sp.]|nr:glycosyltransferase family 4 protein [Minwuia sp.]
MRVLFLHNNFPAQYRHVATSLAAEQGHQLVFGTQARNGEIPGVTKAFYKPAREVRAETHHYVRNLESAVLNGQSVYRMCMDLKRQGFVPDLVCGHSGWGPTLYVKDAFPDTRVLSYFEWFYHAHGSDADYLPESEISSDDECRIRTRNAAILLDLANCDWGLCPTLFQRDQFPKIFHNKLTVLHDGVDTDFFKPDPDAVMKVGDLDLSGAKEIVTYATRGMEPYRGFPQFVEAVAQLQKQRPDMHAVIVGQDRVAYGRKLPDGRTFKQKMLEELELDMSRVHFTGLLPYGEYLKVLQASHAHVYMTVPFVLSWSLIESMATGCLIISSDTEPVREVIRDGKQGLLVDFFDVDGLARRIAEALDNRESLKPLQEAAREVVLKNYALKDTLPKHVRLLKSVAAGTLPPVLSPPKPAARPGRRRRR